MPTSGENSSGETAGLFATAENPAPAGAEAFHLACRDGVRLRVARFPARARPLKGTVCLFQGRAEFIEKYFETIEDLTGRGFTVAALDWRGQGGSQRHCRNARRGHVRHFDDFGADFDVFMREFAFTECPPPYFGLAHSMGGAILLDAVRRRPTWLDRLVLTAPMISLSGHAAGPAARRLSTVLAGMGFGRLFIPGGGEGRTGYNSFEDNVLTGDERRFRRTAAIIDAAPELAIGSPTIGWVRAAHRAIQLFENPERIAAIRTPTLFVAAADERIVSNRAIETLSARMRTARVVTLPNARHEILMERESVRQSFFAAFDAFIPGTSAFAEVAEKPRARAYALGAA